MSDIEGFESSEGLKFHVEYFEEPDNQRWFYQLREGKTVKEYFKSKQLPQLAEVFTKVKDLQESEQRRLEKFLGIQEEEEQEEEQEAKPKSIAGTIGSGVKFFVSSASNAVSSVVKKKADPLKLEEEEKE